MMEKTTNGMVWYSMVYHSYNFTWWNLILEPVSFILLLSHTLKTLCWPNTKSLQEFKPTREFFVCLIFYFLSYIVGISSAEIEELRDETPVAEKKDQAPVEEDELAVENGNYI